MKQSVFFFYLLHWILSRLVLMLMLLMERELRLALIAALGF
jgi:hypothetical protein